MKSSRVTMREAWRIAVACVLMLLAFSAGSLLTDSGGRTTVTLTVSAPPAPGGPGRRPRPPAMVGGFRESRAGAVAAAAAYLDDLDGPALLSPSRVGAILAAVAAPSVRMGLLAAYRAAAVQVDEQLGLNTVPAPLVIVRAAPVGYRLQGFGRGEAVVSVWRVGIVGSGATVTPQQSWRTETVSLVWEDGWRIVSLATAPGPTPPLATTDISTPGELFASVPQFATFTHVRP